MQVVRSLTLKSTLRVLTALGAAAAVAVAAIPLTQENGSSASGAGPVAAQAAPAVLPEGGVNVPQYTQVGSDLTLTFACAAPTEPEDSTTDASTDASSTDTSTTGTSSSADTSTGDTSTADDSDAEVEIATSVTAENQDNSSRVLNTYDVAANGKATFRDLDKFIEVTWTWKLPATVREATGLIVRAACAESFDPADTTTFAQASTNVVVPPNTFVNATFPSSAERGDRVYFSVKCDHFAAGAFTLYNAAGQPTLYSNNKVKTSSKGVESKTPTTKGFDLIVLIPDDFPAGDYKAEFECVPLDDGSSLKWLEEEPSDSVKSARLAFKVVGPKIPPTN